MNGGLSMVEMKSGYKMTEVGVIPEDWEVCELRNHLVLLTDYDANGSFADMASNVVTTTGNGYAWYVRATDLEQQSSLSEVKYVDEKSYRFLRKSTLYGGEVLLAKRGEIGKVYYFQMKTKRATLAPNLYLLKLKDTINSYFLFSLFKSTFGQNLLKSINASTSLGAIYKDDVKGLNILIPPFEEQASIAAALSDVDSLISALTKKIEKKKAIKQGLMQQLLTGKKRLSGFNDKWKSMLLGDIAEVKDGTHQTPQYVKSGGKPFYSVENVTADDFKNVKHISLEEHKALTSNYRIEKGDVLMTRIGSIGCCKYVDWDVDASFYVSLALLKINEKYDSKFISYLSNIKSFKEEVMLNSLVFAIPQKINLGNISLIKVYIPTSKAEQTAIANILSDCDSEIAALEEKRDKYKEIKQGMMQQLLTGKIRLIK